MIMMIMRMMGSIIQHVMEDPVSFFGFFSSYVLITLDVSIETF